MPRRIDPRDPERGQRLFYEMQEAAIARRHAPREAVPLLREPALWRFYQWRAVAEREPAPPPADPRPRWERENRRARLLAAARTLNPRAFRSPEAAECQPNPVDERLEWEMGR